MKLSSRVKDISESMTLKLNAKAVSLAEQGREIFNLTAGQLPFRPMSEFVNLIRNESDFLKSFQYSPVAGYKELREKIIENFEKTREVSLKGRDVDFDCIVCNGGKHALSNIFGSLIDSGDEVILFAPYWVSYPEMVKFAKGVPIIIESSPYDIFVPSLDEVRRKISPKTRAIVINSPNNPTGVHYTDEWMKGFADLLEEHPDIAVISDEIYYELSYYDPKPTYFYQHRPELLNRTIIVDGISKSLACTGLRIGFLIAPKELTDVIAKLQGQTTSGANSLVQRALCHFDFSETSTYLSPIKKHLRENSEVLGSHFRDNQMANIWYQPLSAFYYFIDFSQAPVMKKYQQDEKDHNDYSVKICEDLLEQYGVATVPGAAFGSKNMSRISLVLEKAPFTEAANRIMKFMTES